MAASLQKHAAGIQRRAVEMLRFMAVAGRNIYSTPLGSRSLSVSMPFIE
jgi:hypothetical protein